VTKGIRTSGLKKIKYILKLHYVISYIMFDFLIVYKIND
jgi:hypothetical protein